MKLSFLTSKKIDNLAKKADKYSCKGEFEKSISCYEKMIELLPEPKEDWEAYEWAKASLGDTYYILKDYNSALQEFQEAIGYTDNPFVFLRYGQCCYLTGDYETAKKYLSMALDFGGEEVFETEDKCYRQMAEENQVEEEYIKEDELEEIDFENNPFSLPEDFLYLQKESDKLEYLWDIEPIRWDMIYEKNVNLFYMIPEELYNNDFTFITLVAIMGATLKLEKFNAFEEWLPIFKKVINYRPDYEMVYVWEGLYHIKKGNISEAINCIQNIVKQYGTRAIKNFYYFDNEVYNFYMKYMKN